MARGFFVPNSISSNYVSNKRTNTGAYQWDTAASEIGLGQQAAFQSLNKQYSTTINNAYANYLAANRGIQGSMMGQGYKEAYLQASQEDLQSRIAETSMSAASARSQITGETSQALSELNKEFTTEVTNMDRVSQSMGQYLDYVKSLTGAKDASKTYLSEEQMNQSLDNMYDVLFNVQPQDYVDAEGNIGLSYAQWVQSNTKDTQADRDWTRWLFGMGGFEQFKQAAKTIKPITTNTTNVPNTSQSTQSTESEEEQQSDFRKFYELYRKATKIGVKS